MVLWKERLVHPTENFLRMPARVQDSRLICFGLWMLGCIAFKFWALGFLEFRPRACLNPREVTFVGFLVMTCM